MLNLEALGITSRDLPLLCISLFLIVVGLTAALVEHLLARRDKKNESAALKRAAERNFPNDHPWHDLD